MRSEDGAPDNKAPFSQTLPSEVRNSGGFVRALALGIFLGFEGLI
jgi:hypothetical protein